MRYADFTLLIRNLRLDNCPLKSVHGLRNEIIIGGKDLTTVFVCSEGSIPVKPGLLRPTLSDKRCHKFCTYPTSKGIPAKPVCEFTYRMYSILAYLHWYSID